MYKNLFISGEMDHHI